MGDKRVSIGFCRLKAELRQHLWPSDDFASAQYRTIAFDVGECGQELLRGGKAVLTLRSSHLHHHIDK